MDRCGDAEDEPAQCRTGSARAARGAVLSAPMLHAAGVHQHIARECGQPTEEKRPRGVGAGAVVGGR